jgi:hypothetical protein
MLITRCLRARLSVVSVLLGTAVASAQTLQDQGPPLHRIVHRNTFAVRYNPVGLVYDGRFSYRLRLYESSSVALRDNFIGFGVAPALSPLLGRVGAYVEVQPATVLGFWATYSFVQYFGTFNLFQSFPSARSTYSDNEIAWATGSTACPAHEPNTSPTAPSSPSAPIFSSRCSTPSSFAAARGSFGRT